jgi:hypothetical protein
VPPAFTRVSYLASTYSLTLKMEATCSSETSADFQWTTRRYTPDDRTLDNHRCENLESYISKKYFHNYADFCVTLIINGSPHSARRVPLIEKHCFALRNAGASHYSQIHLLTVATGMAAKLQGKVCCSCTLK